MNVSSTDLFSRAEPVGGKGRFFDHPLVRIVTALLFLAPGFMLHNLLMIYVIEKLPHPWFSILRDCMFIADIPILLFLYGWYVRKREKREPVEISLGGSVPEFGRGALVSLGLVGVIVLALTAAKFYRIETVGSPWKLLDALFIFCSGAFIQVMLFRIILFRLTEELLGTWPALVATSLVFAVAHLWNPNASVLSFTALVVSDVLLIAAFVFSRRLWLVWGMHAAWNFFQDGVFGMPNSGITTLPSWITPAIDGPDWATGGAVGIEASVGGIALPLVAGIILFRLAARRGQIVAPQWSRRNARGGLRAGLE